MIIPCGAEKRDGTHAARDLYTGQMFRLALAAALEQLDGDTTHVLVLSALHGLIRLTDQVAAYDVKMGQPGSVTATTVAAQAAAHGIVYDAHPDVFALLPQAYWAVLDAALRADDIYAADVYEDCAGIGFQRKAASIAARPADLFAAAA